MGKCGISSFGRAIAFQAIGGQFEPGIPLKNKLVGVIGNEYRH